MISQTNLTAKEAEQLHHSHYCPYCKNENYKLKRILDAIKILNISQIIKDYKSITLMNIFPTPLLRMLGSRLEYITRIDLPFTGVKFKTSIALAAAHN